MADVGPPSTFYNVDLDAGGLKDFLDGGCFTVVQDDDESEVVEVLGHYPEDFGIEVGQHGVDVGVGGGVAVFVHICHNFGFWRLKDSFLFFITHQKSNCYLCRD
ncbi:MAG: hypothetical protein IKC02_01850 [Oscillospiraceae bacterium]|nr:hypothetical protein [Oscillospiraceae bacterium]